MGRPIVGITLDSESPGGYSKLPWYAVRQNYVDSVADAGGIPLLLPHRVDLVGDYLDRLSALVVIGGDFDIDPVVYGASSRHATIKTKDIRTAFEMAIAKGALARDFPVLGICGGQQLLHVALGGSLIQHIPDEAPGALAHEQPNPRTEPGHSVEIVAGTLLHRIVRTETLAVNSAHHQAAKDVPPGVVVNARASDGIIEGIEAPRHRFCLGVQWHPEYAISEGDRAIFRAFVEAAAPSS